MSTKTQPASNRTTMIWIGVGIAAVVGLFVWALLSGGTGGGGGGSFEVEAFGEVDIDGDALPILDPANTGIAEFDDAIGIDAPVVSGTDYDGVASTVGGDGPQVVVFLAHWCPHCQAEVPRLVEQMAGGNTINDVPVVGVATSSNATRANFPPASWLEAEGWTGEIVMDDSNSSTLRAFGLGSFPAWVAIAADGTVAARATGEMTPEMVAQFAELAKAG